MSPRRRGARDLGEQLADSYTATGVVWDGIDWRVTWGFNNAVSVARVTTGGAVLDPGGVSVPGPMTGPTAGLPGGGVELIWSAPFDNLQQYDVFSAAIPPTNTAGAEPDAFHERADADPLGHRDRQEGRDDDLAQ